MRRTIHATLEWRGRYSEPRLGKMWLPAHDAPCLMEARAYHGALLDFGGRLERNDAALELLMVHRCSLQAAPDQRGRLRA